jgi:hypothetical protein
LADPELTWWFGVRLLTEAWLDLCPDEDLVLELDIFLFPETELCVER